MGINWAKISIAAGIMFIVAACSGGIAQSGLAAKGAQLFDTALADSEWVVCYAASIGSVKRRYARSDQTADIYNKFCDQAQGFLVTPDNDTPVSSTPGL